ncbi:Sulfotransferase [uncultured Candidatus Thioglobus sp.]|nr:Sulfotransferase [uncultured Candidatus Thioglobus sp.]
MQAKHPNFFILGAPKCGTTSMDMWLASNSAIFMAKKEPHYFNTDHSDRSTPQLEKYQALFADVTDAHTIIGETSVRYLYSQDAVANILAYAPEAKFMVMLRNPIDMAYSWHNQLCFETMENVKNFETAWSLQSQRKLGKHIPKYCAEAKMLQYGDVCCLGAQLQRLYQLVPPERVHLVLFDDLLENPKLTYQSVLNFLGVADDGKQDFPHLNAAKTQHIFWLRAFIDLLTRLKNKLTGKKIGLERIVGLVMEKNKKIKQRPPLSPKMRQTLIEYFADDVQLLETLIKRDLSHWLK